MYKWKSFMHFHTCPSLTSSILFHQTVSATFDASLLKRCRDKALISESQTLAYQLGAPS